MYLFLDRLTLSLFYFYFYTVCSIHIPHTYSTYVYACSTVCDFIHSFVSLVPMLNMPFVLYFVLCHLSYIFVLSGSIDMTLCCTVDRGRFL